MSCSKYGHALYTDRCAPFLRRQMRLGLLIIFSMFRTQLIGQELLTGTVIDVATMKQISVDKSFSFYISGKKLISIPVDSVGQFKINKNEVLELGDTVTLSIGSIGTDFNFADFEIINIPTDKIELVINRIFVTKTFMIPSCGADCFTVNNKRTYKKKTITVDNGRIKYIIRRFPERRPSNSPFDKVKYQTDFKRDRV
jgi:hypothetical protein